MNILAITLSFPAEYDASSLSRAAFLKHRKSNIMGTYFEKHRSMNGFVMKVGELILWVIKDIPWIYNLNTYSRVKPLNMEDTC